MNAGPDTAVGACDTRPRVTFTVTVAHEEASPLGLIPAGTQIRFECDSCRRHVLSSHGSLWPSWQDALDHARTHEATL